MTSVPPDLDITTIKDRRSLELVQRVVQMEHVFHESRMTQLKELDRAITARIEQLGRG